MTSLFDKKSKQLVATEELQESKPVDLGAALEKLSGGGALQATDVIHKLTTGTDEAEDLAVKSIIGNPGACNAAQVLADYNEQLGFFEVADMLRTLVAWQYRHSCGFKGRRAEQAFGALGGEVEKDFQLEKEAKGLFRR